MFFRQTFSQMDLYEPHFAGVRSNSPRVQSDLLCARLKSSPQTDLKNIRGSRMSENLSSWPQPLAMFYKCSLFVNAESVRQHDRCLSLSEQQVSCSLSNASFSNDPLSASAVTTRTTNWLMASRPAGDLIVIDFSFIHTSLYLDVLEKVLTVIQFFSGSVNDILDELNGEDEIRDSRWGQVPIVVMTIVIMMMINVIEWSPREQKWW